MWPASWVAWMEKPLAALLIFLQSCYFPNMSVTLIWLFCRSPSRIQICQSAEPQNTKREEAWVETSRDEQVATTMANFNCGKLQLWPLWIFICFVSWDRTWRLFFLFTFLLSHVLTQTLEAWHCECLSLVRSKNPTSTVPVWLSASRDSVLPALHLSVPT